MKNLNIEEKEIFSLLTSKQLKMVKPGNTKKDIFITTKTHELFDLYKTREEALKSFEGDIQPES